MSDIDDIAGSIDGEDPYEGLDDEDEFTGDDEAQDVTIYDENVGGHHIQIIRAGSGTDYLMIDDINTSDDCLSNDVYIDLIQVLVGEDLTPVFEKYPDFVDDPIQTDLANEEFGDKYSIDFADIISEIESRLPNLPEDYQP